MAWAVPQRGGIAGETTPACFWATSKLEAGEISVTFLWSSYVTYGLHPLPSQTTNVLSFKAYSFMFHTWQKQCDLLISPPSQVRKDENEQNSLHSSRKVIGLLEVKFSSLSIQQSICGLTFSNSFSIARGLGWVTLARKGVWDGGVSWWDPAPSHLQQSASLYLPNRWRNPTLHPHHQTHQGYLPMRMSSKQQCIPSASSQRKFLKNHWIDQKYWGRIKNTDFLPE